jgi:hypothetical protein
MGRLKQRQKDEHENRTQEAILHYNSSSDPSIHLTAEHFSVAYSMLQGRLGGAQRCSVGHRKLQVLTEYEETSIVEWCEWLDE